MQGDPIAISIGDKLSPDYYLKKLNTFGRKHGIGRLDFVENRCVGMKSRGICETPGGTILLNARRGIESLTLDKGASHLKDEIMPKYAELIYNGFGSAPNEEDAPSIDKQKARNKYLERYNSAYTKDFAPLFQDLLNVVFIPKNM